MKSQYFDSSSIPSYSPPTISPLGNIYIAIGSAIFSYSYEGTLNWYKIIKANPNEYDNFATIDK